MNKVHSFSEVPKLDIPRNQFDLTHEHKTTFDCDYIVPVLALEVMPADTIKLNMSFMARIPSLAHPLMDNVYLDSFFFFVPYRIVWENFRKFFGERHPTPTSSISYTIPQIQYAGAGISALTLEDYLGIPTGVAGSGANTLDYNVLPLRAYSLIWDEWFRDTNVCDALNVDIDDGPDSFGDHVLKKRMKRHDIHTSCLPWLQRGDAVELPMYGTDVPVITKSTQAMTGAQEALQLLQASAGGAPGGPHLLGTTSGSDMGESNISPGTVNQELYPANLYADTSAVVGPDINEFRLAIATQRYLEREARAGTRFPELLNSFYGVNFYDLTYRPQYLGGNSTKIQVSPIANVDSSIGDLGGIGTGFGSNHGFIQSFNEPGVILGLVNCRGTLSYGEGMHRMWSRSTRFDLPNPTFAHLGEQSTLNMELYIDSATLNAGTHDDTFGYQERFAEMREIPSRLSGQMRCQHATSMEAWHLSQELGSEPTLNEAFITSSTPMDRAVNTPAEPHITGDFHFDLKATRALPLYGVPGLSDRM